MNPSILSAELRRLYRSPLTWFTFATIQLVMSTYYLLLVLRYLEQGASLASNGVTQEVLVPYFFTANLCVMLSAPLLTMSSIAEERRNGMLRFLFSMPLSGISMVTGKWLAVCCVGLGMVALLICVPATLFWGASVDPGVFASNALGLILFSGLQISLGLCASALARTPTGAAFTALPIAACLWLADWAARIDGDGSLAGGISTLTRLRSFLHGLLHTADIAYFVLFTLSLLGIAILAVNLERDW